MTLNEDRQKELDQLWLDSLLQESLCPEKDRDRQRIASLFSKPDFELNEAHSAVVHKFSLLVRWLPLVMAASILIAISSWPQFSSSNQKAFAAVDRSLRATPVAREYSIRILRNNLSGDELTRTAQLFLDKSNRFAVRRQSWLGSSDIWIGSDGTNQWFVPRVGPAFKGSERILGGWLMRKDSTSPYLHLNTALNRMKQDYDLTMLSDAGMDGVDGEGTIVCERVHGEWKSKTNSSSDRALPVAIELWADKENGIARRVVLVWNRDRNQVGQAGVTQWSIDLVGYPSLSENWFDPSGHIGVGQRIITIGKEADLEIWPKANEEN